MSDDFVHPPELAIIKWATTSSVIGEVIRTPGFDKLPFEMMAMKFRDAVIESGTGYRPEGRYELTHHLVNHALLDVDWMRVTNTILLWWEEQHVEG